MEQNIKLMTLNCWGLPFPVICKNRPERLAAVGDLLKVSGYDVVVLEEVWVKSDYQKIKEKVRKALPYSHYFYSGTIGSGICVFSKHEILETAYHRYHLNGHAHKIFHGDWFGGKGVGLCKLHVGDLSINLYCSHFHAEYNPGQDEYEAHRLAQAFEISQYIKLTSSECDLVLLAGDLNTAPDNLGYKMITQHANLRDCWTEKKNEVNNEDGGSCDVPGNSYTSSATLKSRPTGERIDYIMLNAKNCDVEVTECTTGGLGQIPSHNVSYSDHEPVTVSLTVKKLKGKSKQPDDESVEKAEKELRETLTESLFILGKGVTQCLSEEKFFQLMVVVLSVLLYIFNSHVDPMFPGAGLLTNFGMATTKLILAIAIGFCVWIALIVKRAEFHGLVACKEDIIKLLGLWD